MSMLPPTEKISLKVSVIAICMGIAYVFGLQFYVGGVERMVFAMVFLLPTGVGLWFLKQPARLLVSAIILLLVIVVPVGVLSPFAAIDAPDANPPGAWEAALVIYPWVAVGLLLVHVLGKHKSEFTPLFKKRGSR